MNKNKDKFGKVLVLMGGVGNEREVSLMSGAMVVEALQHQNIDVHGLDVDLDVASDIIKIAPDRVFIALHGADGEDGRIQGLLDLLHIPYVGSGVTACAMTINKWYTNVLLRGLNLPVLPMQHLTHGKECLDVPLPICVKPACSGSSVGISKVIDIDELQLAYELAHSHGGFVVAEPWIYGREFTVGILGDSALPVVEVVTPKNEFYDYEAKYFSNVTKYICPCDLAEIQQQELQDLALSAFKATGCKDFARVDFIQDQDGAFWLLEINTIPGLTSHSLLPMAAKAIGIEFEDLIVRLLEFTVND